MNATLEAAPTAKLLKFLAAVLIGLSIGTLLRFEPVAVPAVGPVPALLASGFGLAIGLVLYDQPWRTADDCGCGGECEC